MKKTKLCLLLASLGMSSMLVACDDNDKKDLKNDSHINTASEEVEETDEDKKVNSPQKDTYTVTFDDTDYTFKINDENRVIIKDNLGISTEQAIQTIYVNKYLLPEQKPTFTDVSENNNLYAEIEKTDYSSTPLVYYKALYLNNIDTEIVNLQVYDLSEEYELTNDMERSEKNVSVQNMISKFALVDVPKFTEPFGNEAYKFIEQQLMHANKIEVVKELPDTYLLGHNNPTIDNGIANYYVFLDNELLNAKIVEKGYGIVSKYVDDNEKDNFYNAETKDIRDTIMKSEENAKSKKVGVWSKEGYVSETGFPSSKIDVEAYK